MQGVPLVKITMIEVSTAHLHSDTLELFDGTDIYDGGAFPLVMRGRHGYLLWVPQELDGDPDSAMHRPDVAAILALAQKHDANYVLIDGDAPMTHELPEYEHR